MSQIEQAQERYQNSLKDFNFMKKYSYMLPKGNSETPILRYPDGSIKRYDVLKTELNDARFQELESLKAENPNYNYFYVDKIDKPSQFKFLGNYDGIGINYPNTNDEKYTLLFDDPSRNRDISSIVDIGSIFFGKGEIFCIDKKVNSGGKRRKSKRRKSNKRRNTKRRYRK